MSSGMSVSVGISVSVGGSGVSVAVAGTGVAVFVLDGALVRVAVATPVTVAAPVAVALPATLAVAVTLGPAVVAVAVGGVPVTVGRLVSLGVSATKVMVCVMFSVGTGTIYGVSVAGVPSFEPLAAAAVARAGAAGFDGKFGAVVGMIIWMVVLSVTTAVCVSASGLRSAGSAIGVIPLWSVVPLPAPRKMPTSVITE